MVSGAWDRVAAMRPWQTDRREAGLAICARAASQGVPPFALHHQGIPHSPVLLVNRQAHPAGVAPQRTNHVTL